MTPRGFLIAAPGSWFGAGDFLLAFGLITIMLTMLVHTGHENRRTADGRARLAECTQQVAEVLDLASQCVATLDECARVIDDVAGRSGCVCFEPEAIVVTR